jgi:glucosamine--fructose-6-phosphate aminotransferase (isomerizing)
MSLHSEIQEQPVCLGRLLHNERIATEEIAEAIAAEDVRFVLIAARGTSDNSARYANHAWSAINILPIGLAAPSLFTYYNHPHSLRGSLVVGILHRTKKNHRNTLAGL